MAEVKINMACEYKCTSCLIDKKPETAVSFCIVCVEYLCDECMKSHGKTKATRYHKLLTGKDIPANTEIYQKLAQSLLCKIHPEREVQLQCKDHDEFICALCLRSTHRKCENVEDLDEVKDDSQEEKEKLGLLKNNCEEKIKQLNLVKQAREENIESLLREKILCTEERKRLLQEIDKKLEDAVEKEINELIHETKESILDCNNSEEMHIKQKSFLEVVSKYSDTKQLKVILTEATKVCIGQIENEYEPKSFIASTSNNVLIKLLEETEFVSGLAHDKNRNEGTKAVADKVKVFGETVESEECISSIDGENYLQLDDPDETGNAGTRLKEIISPNSPFGKECPDYNHEDVDDKSTDKQNMVPDPYGIRKRNTKLLLDCKLKLSDTLDCKDVLPRDCVVLMDGRIVLLHGGDDQNENNDCINESDNSNKDGVKNDAKANLPSMSVHNGEFDFLFNYDLLEEPCNVCHLEGEDVAITYKKEKRIDLFKVLPSKIEKVSEFHTSHLCRSVCLHNGILVAVFSNEQIHFLDKNNGKMIKNAIWVYKGHSRYKINNPLKIEIGHKGCILIAGKDEVHCLNNSGDSKSSFECYQDETVKTIYGMTVDNEGNLYVCGGNSIYQMRAGKVYINRLLHKMENICDTSWIAFDRKKKRLIVGFDNDTIRVYNFM